jgi:hypothetical protein
LATLSAPPNYHGPGRGAGHSLLALLAGYQLTGDATLRSKADEIVRRVVHHGDDIEARNLLDAERRWSYTAFFQALGSYLSEKAERREFDAMYAYARASLLHYARWMAEHEYPYLERPEKLEYPTETWAAQDLRKSDVFYLAAAETSGEERIRFAERGAFFARTSLHTLESMPTSRLTRPVVLLLSHGWLHRLWEHRGSWPLPATVPQLPAERSPRPFVPQKAIAMRRAATAAIALFVVGAAAVWLLWP